MEQPRTGTTISSPQLDSNGKVIALASAALTQRKAPLRRRLNTFSSLAHVSYRHLWIGTLFMSLGQWIQQVTLGYVMYDLTGSSVLLGVMSTVRALPFLFLSPVAGVIVDRVDRRKLLLAIQGSLVVTAIAMGLFVRSGLLEP